MRPRPVLLPLLVLFLIGYIRADDDDDDDDASHRFSGPVISHFSPAVHHFGSPVLPKGIRTTTTRPTTAGRAPAIEPTRIVLSTTIRTVARELQAAPSDASTTPRITTTSSPEKKPPTPTGAATPSRDDSCGVAFNGPSRLIVGGRNAEPFEWPWMVALVERHDREHFCGGVLLTDRHVLTAAHCFLGRRASRVMVILGEYNLFRDQGSEEYFRIADLQEHPDFKEYDSHFRNDIAILTLDKSVTFNEAIRPVCLPPHDPRDYNGLNATALGWGDTDGDEFVNSWAHVLQEVELPIVSQRECDDQHFSIPIVEDKEICAAPFDGGRDTCTGDSGGPLLVQMNKRWTLIGLTSWGPSRCGSGLPGVYTRVDGFTDWIWDQLR